MKTIKELFKPSELDLIILAVENECQKREEALKSMEDDETKAYAEEQLSKLLNICNKLKS